METIQKKGLESLYNFEHQSTFDEFRERKKTFEFWKNTVEQFCFKLADFRFREPRFIRRAARFQKFYNENIAPKNNWSTINCYLAFDKPYSKCYIKFFISDDVDSTMEKLKNLLSQEELKAKPRWHFY
jgi:hypothetical protein